jgi:hypothetical protein
MKVTKFNRLSELIANNTLVYVLGEHGTVVVGFGGSLGIVLCSEELARQIHVLGGSTPPVSLTGESFQGFWHTRIKGQPAS